MMERREEEEEAEEKEEIVGINNVIRQLVCDKQLDEAIHHRFDGN